MKKFIIITILAFLFNLAFSQEKKDSINWISMKEAGNLFIKNQKPIMIYFYQKGNKDCEYQESSTFSNPEVANYINILFYPVKIDVETKDTITFFDGKSYANSKKTGKFHDIKYMLAGANDTLPMLVFFSRQAKGQSTAGYKNRDEIFRYLVYYNENIDKSVDFKVWKKYHLKGYPPGQKQIITRLLIKWKTLDEAVSLNKKQPRKMLLNMYNYNRQSCTLMRTQTYNNPEIAKYLNEKFYPVSIDVFTQDTLKIFNQTYINENKPHKYHQLPIAALEGKMIFPAFLILDENGKVLEKISKYMTPENIAPILHYYGDDKYKTQSWEKFLENYKSKLKIKDEN